MSSERLAGAGDRAAIAIVGAGPRGAGLLERLAASVEEFLPRLGSGTPLDVHLIDPYPAGAGRIWRHAQSPLLAMNSMAADVTMFTDDSVTCDGPVVPGPSMWEWAQDLRAGHLDGGRGGADALGPELTAELRALTATTFPSRRLQSAYLGWVLRHVIAGLPAGMRAHVHECRAVGLTDDGDTQLVHLDGGTTLRVDAVVLASGHLDATPTDDELDLAARAAATGLRYVPPEQTTDTDLSVIAPGEPVIVRGMGLAFVDLAVLLFEGRGGRFEPDPDLGGGELRYVPSGREPVLHVGSPRGSLYHAKTEYALRGGRPQLPRFLGPRQVGPLVERGGVDMRAEVWPLMAKEIAWGWYHELLHGHPERVRLDADTFTERYAAAEWASPEMAALLAEAVPDPVDRIDFAALDRPLDGVRAGSLDALQPLVRGHVAEDLRQHVDPAHTPHLGAFVAMLSVFGQTTPLVTEDALTARSKARDVGWWQGFFNGVASGPPGFRVRQLLALSRAGFLRFLGPGMWSEVDAERRCFRAGGSAVPGASVTATVLVDARLQEPSVSRTTDPLLAGLLRRGAAAEEILVDDDGTVLRNTGTLRVRPADGAVLDAAGRPHPRRFAIGPHTNVRVAGAFTRPGTNAQSLRYNDTVARALLGSLRVRARASSAA